MGYRDSFFRYFPRGCDKWGNARSDGWYECHRCGLHMRGGDSRLQVDHIKAQAIYRADGRPVSNDITNLAAICQHCNGSKGSSYDFRNWTHKKYREIMY